MQHDETRENTTAKEAQIIEADTRPMENRVADGWWATLNAKAASRYADGTPRDEPKAEPAQWIHYD